MTRDERLAYNKAITCIEYKLIGRRDKQDPPTMEQYQALQVAMDALIRMQQSTGKSQQRHIGLLQYHIKEPTAILFKDRYTMDALTAGIHAIKWLVGQDTMEELSHDSK